MTSAKRASFAFQDVVGAWLLIGADRTDRQRPYVFAVDPKLLNEFFSSMNSLACGTSHLTFGPNLNSSILSRLWLSTLVFTHCLTSLAPLIPPILTVGVHVNLESRLFNAGSPTFSPASGTHHPYSVRPLAHDKIFASILLHGYTPGTHTRANPFHSRVLKSILRLLVFNLVPNSLVAIGPRIRTLRTHISGLLRLFLVHGHSVELRSSKPCPTTSLQLHTIYLLLLTLLIISLGHSKFEPHSGAGA